MGPLLRDNKPKWLGDVKMTRFTMGAKVRRQSDNQNATVWIRIRVRIQAGVGMRVVVPILSKISYQAKGAEPTSCVTGDWAFDLTRQNIICVQAPEIVGVKVYNGDDVVTDGTVLECDVRWDSAHTNKATPLTH